MRHGSLFSGIGGFDLAAEWMGWENVFHCEWMEFPRKVLDYYFPNADSHIDICKTDFKKYANKIDILTGGFPCQPFSLAGKRKGTNDERYLWHEMLRAVQEIKPKYIIAENVFGITNIDGGMVFEQVCLDLENEGYEVQAFIIPAAAKNAPHRRDRVWFIAYSYGTTTEHNGRTNDTKKGKIWWNKKGNVFGELCSNGNVTNSECIRRVQRWKDIQCIESNGKISICNGRKWDDSNTEKQGLEGMRRQTGRCTQLCRRQFRIQNWQKFPTQSPICGGDDGIPTKLDGITFPKWRAESIKAYGNAIVPQIALELFKIIETL